MSRSLASILLIVTVITICSGRQPEVENFDFKPDQPQLRPAQFDFKAEQIDPRYHPFGIPSRNVKHDFDNMEVPVVNSLHPFKRTAKDGDGFGSEVDFKRLNRKPYTANPDNEIGIKEEVPFGK